MIKKARETKFSQITTAYRQALRRCVEEPKENWNNFKAGCLSSWADQQKLNTSELQGIRSDL
jgi:hypothetical protein